MKPCYITHTHPQALAENCIIGPHYRITLLTDKLVRFEYNAQNKFEDRPTQIVMNRDFPAVSYTVEHTADGLVVRTDRLRIVYDEKPFSPNGLSVALVGYENAHTGNWYYGDTVHDLKGTVRTLDAVDGDNVELGHGLISTEGYAVLDDSTSLVLQDDGWVESRSGGEDFYFFGYGRDYLEAIQDFYHLSGHAPMLPRYALGNWWSRFYPYTEETYLSLMERFHNENLPFSVAVIDMDWHIVDVDPKYGNGWTGFTWNKKLFPKPERFLSELHRRGMKVTLNVHPADGIRAYEDAYTKIAKDMGVDLESGHAVEFDPADPKFLQNYYADVLRPLEDEGVDFWWVDWQQGTHTRIAGLDPLWMLNHYGFLDNGQGGKRPMAFSRYGGPGSHRYPVGFSGDTIVTWDSLRFQPYFTATSSNIGYCWWSHDIGGHMRGIKDDEMMARWTQYGIFSPIMRLHSVYSEFCGKEPWRYKKETEKVMGDALRFRHKMLPYLYTMNHRCYAEGIPLVLPLYYIEQNRAESYEHPNEYYFGSDLLVLPVTSPRLSGLNVAKEKLYLPDGVWYDIFTKRVYRGNRELDIYRPLDKIPVFAKAGTILPLTDEIDPATISQNPKQLHVCVYLGADGTFTLYEDDNETTAYETQPGVRTTMQLCGESFTIHAAQGQTELLPSVRQYTLEFNGCADLSDKVTVRVDGKAIPFTAAYEPVGHVFTVTVSDIPVTENLLVSLGSDAVCISNDVQSEIFAFLDQAEIQFIWKDQIFNLVKNTPDKLLLLSKLSALELPADLYRALVELITAY